MAGNTRSEFVARRLTVRGVAVVTAALSTVAGCGGGGDEGDGGAAAVFCEEFEGYEERFSGGASHDEVLAALRSLDPPDEIADDVETLTGAVETLSTVDSSDPDAVAEFQAGPSAAAEEANANILGFVDAECSGR